MTGIYSITNLCNDKRYIGSSARIKARFAEHRCSLRKGRHPNQHLQSAWSKYGENAFEFYVVEITEHLLEREEQYILLYEADDRSKGYNLHSLPTDTTKSEEHRRKISETWKKKYADGYVHHRKGMKNTPAMIEAVRQSNIGRKQSVETITKRVSQLRRPIVQLNTEGIELRSFCSISDAAKTLKLKKPHICRCLKESHRTTGGYKFKYKETA